MTTTVEQKGAKLQAEVAAKDRKIRAIGLGRLAETIRDEHGDANPKTIELAIGQRTRKNPREIASIEYSDAGMGRVFRDEAAYSAYRSAELCGRIKSMSGGVTTLDNNVLIHRTYKGFGGAVV